MSNNTTVKVIAHSINEYDIPIITVHMHYPRIIHSEIMTHRVFSRNARSSRAVPVAKLIEEVINSPFIPTHWGKNQKGMQASEECNNTVKITNTINTPNSYLSSIVDQHETHVSRETAWLHARDNAVEVAKAFNESGYHKQLVNRLLEPFMYIDTLITSTHWANFFALRDHQDAEPHFRDLAQLTKEAINKSTPLFKQSNQWHLPYVTPEEETTFDNGILTNISAARCARISYEPFDGNPSIEKELERVKLLMGTPMHSSPFEHQAITDTFDGKSWLYPNNHRNYNGWIQYRSLVPNDTVAD